MKSSAIFYVAFVLIALGSVLFGLDWQPATLSAMPDADVTAYVAPVPPPKPVIVVAAPAGPSVAAPLPPAANPTLANPAPARPPAPRAVQTPLCDVAACAAAYRSFRESDCTYNPSVGPRQLCTKGVVPTAAPVAPVAPPAQTPAPVAQTPAPQPPSSDSPPSIVNPEPGTQPAAQPSGACNVSACATAYRSFRESDCTFNPSFGPRQVCKK